METAGALLPILLTQLLISAAHLQAWMGAAAASVAVRVSSFRGACGQSRKGAALTRSRARGEVLEAFPAELRDGATARAREQAPPHYHRQGLGPFHVTGGTSRPHGEQGTHAEQGSNAGQAEGQRQVPRARYGSCAAGAARRTAPTARRDCVVERMQRVLNDYQISWISGKLIFSMVVCFGSFFCSTPFKLPKQTTTPLEKKGKLPSKSLQCLLRCVCCSLHLLGPFYKMKTRRSDRRSASNDRQRRNSHSARRPGAHGAAGNNQSHFIWAAALPARPSSLYLVIPVASPVSAARVSNARTSHHCLARPVQLF